MEKTVTLSSGQILRIILIYQVSVKRGCPSASSFFRGNGKGGVCLNIIRCDNIYFSYGKGCQVLKDVSFSLKRGEFAAMLGANGSGKTTLSKIASGVIRPDKGQTLLNGRDISTLSKRETAKTIAFVAQELKVDFPFTCMEIVLMGRYSRLSGLGVESDADRKTAEKFLEMTGSLHLKDRPVQCLSGGEKQRVFIAQALAQEPELLILDEPVSALDINYTVRIMNLLKSLNKELGITILAVLHDLNLASLYADSAILLKEGRILAQGSPLDVLNPDTIEDAYGIRVRGLFSADGKHSLIFPEVGDSLKIR